jgi:hypothetical protein
MSEKDDLTTIIKISEFSTTSFNEFDISIDLGILTFL